MASGFSNSQDQLTPVYIRVYVDMSGYDTNETRETSGAVEPFDYDSFATLNTSLNKSIRRARGNIRWNAILMELQRFANCEIVDVTATKSGPAFETEADDVALALSFTVGYTFPSAVFDGWQNLLWGNGGNGEFADGSYMTTDAYEQRTVSDRLGFVADCVRESVVRGITLGGTAGYTRRYRVMDPVLVEQRDQNVVVKQPDTPNNIWTSITSCSVIESMTQQTIDTGSDT